ncbi:MAG: MarR family transcriptional regulator [Planctomycetaceae bacterium]|nr:MarR family transcriptional regulator [Planctomycetaceae bacterium]
MSRRNLDLNQLGFLLGRAYYNYIGFLERFIADEGLDEHVKPGMGSLLFALYREDDRTITEVSQELQVAKSTMTGMVGRMKDAGLVTIIADKHDGRVTRLRLTELARSIEPRCIRVAARVEKLLCRGFQVADQKRLRSSLVKLTATMTEHLQSRRRAAKRRAAKQTKA